ncbi:hypothetical protein Patl1_15511 [Pistacia atlantica]|uniref:Uncharacterized protein n=1 Tax=Pistacia atlantica TaxID=434234 RepID=A0ACC1B7C5_9ROSI|nr:hypothetical protein Patl1_15511 [Pistacia atlantica]
MEVSFINMQNQPGNHHEKDYSWPQTTPCDQKYPSCLVSIFRNNYTVVPQWIIVMYNKEFFGNCMAHPNTKKNEVDRFCIDCLSSLCCHCLPFHTRHRYVKIRRYVYNDVINRHDLSKLFNCSGIQVGALFGDRHREEIKDKSNNNHNHNLKLIVKDEDEDKEYLTPPSPKRQNQKRSRKGIPLRGLQCCDFHHQFCE